MEVFLGVEIESNQGGDFTKRIKTQLNDYHSTHGVVPTLVDLAGLVGLSTRTVQRRLAEEGITLDEIVLTHRKKIFARLIDTPAPLDEVGAGLGFADRSALYQFCKRLWGKSPSDIRKRNSTDLKSVVVA